jgi:hypothetical protein
MLEQLRIGGRVCGTNERYGRFMTHHAVSSVRRPCGAAAAGRWRGSVGGALVGTAAAARALRLAEGEVSKTTRPFLDVGSLTIGGASVSEPIQQQLKRGFLLLQPLHIFPVAGVPRICLLAKFGGRVQLMMARCGTFSICGGTPDASCVVLDSCKPTQRPASGWYYCLLCLLIC